jgi:hypothetical protein
VVNARKRQGRSLDRAGRSVDVERQLHGSRAAACVGQIGGVKLSEVAVQRRVAALAND